METVLSFREVCAVAQKIWDKCKEKMEAEDLEKVDKKKKVQGIIAALHHLGYEQEIKKYRKALYSILYDLVLGGMYIDNYDDNGKRRPYKCVCDDWNAKYLTWHIEYLD